MPVIKDPRWSAVKIDGTPAAGATMHIYQAGTDILASIYASDNFTDSNRLENPLIADAYGFFPLPFLQSGNYKVRILDVNGALISQIDSLAV